MSEIDESLDCPDAYSSGNRHAMPPISIDQAIRARLTLI